MVHRFLDRTWRWSSTFHLAVQPAVPIDSERKWLKNWEMTHPIIIYPVILWFFWSLFEMPHVLGPIQHLKDMVSQKNGKIWLASSGLGSWFVDPIMYRVFIHAPIGDHWIFWRQQVCRQQWGFYPQKDWDRCSKIGLGISFTGTTWTNHKSFP